MKKIIWFIMVISMLFLVSCGRSISKATIPPDECFEIYENRITKYNFNNENCPTDIIIPEQIRWTEITLISKDAFKWHIIEKIRNNPDLHYIDSYIDDLVKKEIKWNITKEEFLNAIKDIKNKLNLKLLTSIEFSNKMEWLGDWEFMLHNLEKITWGENLASIQHMAFFWNNIKEIDFSRVKKVIWIWPVAFLWNNLKKIKLPKEAKYFKYTFDRDVKIENINETEMLDESKY